MKNFQKKVTNVLVTGGSGGIGQAVCREFSRLGAFVLAPSRRELRLNNPGSIWNWLRRHSHWVPDVMILNAGINDPQAFLALKGKNWRNTLQVNLESNFYLIQNMAPKMIQRGGGRIVCVSSILARRARLGRCAYSVSKAALEMLVRSAATELAPDGILVNAIAPGFILTEMTRKNNSPQQIKKIIKDIPLGRLGCVDEVVRWIVYLSSTQNTYMTGQTIIVDGGYTLR